MTPPDAPQVPRFYTPAEVATMFRVDAKTVTRWARAGKIGSIKTLGGHRRYHADEVDALLAGSTVAPKGTCPKCTYKFGSPSHMALCVVQGGHS